MTRLLLAALSLWVCSATGAFANCGKEFYPPDAVAAGIEGDVIVNITVGPDGKVEDSVVAESSGHADLDAAAVACSLHWTFKPAMRDGKPVRGSKMYRVRWILKDPTPAAPSETDIHDHNNWGQSRIE